MSDSALTTYFGKPAFHNYGSHNVAPSSGGLVYGEYMKTHNVNPHSGPNKPACQQVYKRALRGYQEVAKSAVNPKKQPLKCDFSKERKPEPPRHKPLKRSQTERHLNEERGPIYPVTTRAEDTFKIQKPTFKPDHTVKPAMKSLNTLKNANRAVTQKASQPATQRTAQPSEKPVS